MRRLRWSSPILPTTSGSTDMRRELGTIQHKDFKMASGEMSPAEFTDFLCRVCSLLASHSADGSIHFICMDWRHMGELLTAGKQAYSELKNVCVWAKDNAGM